MDELLATLNRDTKLSDAQKATLCFLNYYDRKTIEQARKALLRVSRGKSQTVKKCGT